MDTLEGSACLRCGLPIFPGVASVQYHASVCDGNLSIHGPWRCQGCHKSSFKTRQAFGGHVRCCPGLMKAATNERTSNDSGSCSKVMNDRSPLSKDDRISSLKIPALEKSRSKLSDYNYLLTEWIEIIQASEQDAASSHNRKRRTKLGDIGFRCLACANAGRMLIGSTKFTDCLEHIPHGMFVMVDRHMLKTCPYVPADVKDQLLERKCNSTSQSLSKHRIGLPAYLRLVYHELRLENIRDRQGVRQRNL